jgi:hypothetical protein
MKRVFVEANPNEEFVGQLKDLTIRSQNVMLCPINQLLEVRSVRNNYEDINEIWNELAVASYEDDIFSFQNGKYYILMRQGLRLMLQQDSFIENKPFTILYKTCEVKKIEEWFNNHRIEVVQNQTVDDQWGIVSINGCTLQQWQHLSGEALSKTKKVSDIKLRYGIKSSSYEREYLPDFLPDVEAYLPGKFSVEIFTNPVNNNENPVYIKQIENVENCESSNHDYCWRSFSITLNSSEVQTINVCFKNEENEEIQRIFKRDL